MPSTKNANGDSHFPQKLKAFFRINSGSKDGSTSASSSLKAESKTPFRQSRFFSVGRLRSATIASEGHPLDESMSPTAHANPYFAHQGQPGLRHHNEGSVPPSPPDTPILKINGPGGGPEQPAISTKEELARKLRRVASAPNAQGLFSKGAKSSGERPATAELTKEPLAESKGANTLGFANSKSDDEASDGLAIPDTDGLGALPPPGRSPLAFRRTYSSNSIKVRNVEVGPQSFDKIKLIGKGDVGKVYLVREKKSSRLYAMKGQGTASLPGCCIS
jgi:protein-serine/threonine kinase